jgi:hypothetical protein
MAHTSLPCFKVQAEKQLAIEWGCREKAIKKGVAS